MLLLYIPYEFCGPHPEPSANRRKSEPAPRARRDSDPPPAAPREESPPPPTPDQPAVNLAETIPPEIMEKVKTWKVKQAAITQGRFFGFI